MFRPAMSSNSRRFLHKMMMMSSPKAKTKPYPIGRDHHPPTTKLQHHQRQEYCSSPLWLLHHRVHILINDISDLDTAAKHARSAVHRERNPEMAIATCKAIIGAMCDAGRFGDALDLFHFFFNESEIKPDIASCNLIIKSHCEQGRLDDALQLYYHLSSSENTTPSPDHNTYDLLTKALVDAGMMDQALDLLLRGRDELFNFQEPAMYMNLIRGFLEQGNLDMAYQLRDDFKTCSISNKIAILNSAFVEYLFKQGKDEEAMELYRTSLNNKDGFTANANVGNAYLKVFLKYAKKTQAWALFQYMLDNCVYRLNVDTLNMMVNECLEVGRFSDAVNIFTENKAKSEYPPLRAAYRNLITRLCQNRRLSEAESVFGELLKEKYLKPDAATYKAMIHAYVEYGRVDDAFHTANHMIAANFHKLEKGQLLKVDPYLIKRSKHHFHYIESLGIDLILGCNGFIWVGEHVEVRDPMNDQKDDEISTKKRDTLLETRQNICRIGNVIRVLSNLGFTVSQEVVIEIVNLSNSKNIDIHDMLGSEFHVVVAENEAERRRAKRKK